MNGKSIRSYLLAGIVVWVPILVTLVVLRFIVDLFDKTISLLPLAYQPEQWLGVNVPGFGILLSLLVLFLTGVLATNFLGQRLVFWSESLLERIPLVRSIYTATKQMIQAVFSANSHAFRNVLLVEYPRKGLWSIAFQTGVAREEISLRTGAEMLCLFIPTTPNPTGGFLVMVPRTEVLELSMSVDDAFKLIVSLGVMQQSASPSAGG
ncbi:MAG: hypothetical protein B7X00_01520 [Legionella sp. 21-45-4]|nr:MAG: hypothetical protein B7X00_01520 [Legionella sp. 21-45-4]